MKPITGHFSPLTAYIIEDYPYGSLRCVRRSWIETTKHGQRICHQTTDPKKSVEYWNKPKKSTYSDLIVMGIAEDTGYLTSDRISFGHASLETIELFLDKYASVLTEEPYKTIAKTGRFIALTRKHMQRLSLNHCKSGNIYDVPREFQQAVLIEAKLTAVEELKSY